MYCILTCSRIKEIKVSSQLCLYSMQWLMKTLYADYRFIIQFESDPSEAQDYTGSVEFQQKQQAGWLVVPGQY